MDNINTVGVRKGVPRSMLFADDIVLVNEDRGELERELEDWRQAMEARGLRVSRSKTEEMTLNKARKPPRIDAAEGEGAGSESLSTWDLRFRITGECEREVTRRIQAGWAG